MPSPFEVLKVPPTLDRAAVKRAYFAELAQHPPHADPEGFRRLREAYETLSAPGGLERAWAMAPPDVAALLAQYRAQFDDALARAAAETAETVSQAEQVRAFVERLSRLDWPAAATAWKGD